MAVKNTNTITKKYIYHSTCASSVYVYILLSTILMHISPKIQQITEKNKTFILS